MYSKKNAKYLSVKQESCHFRKIHFNVSHATPIQGIIQAVLFCLLLHACLFICQTSEMLEKEISESKKKKSVLWENCQPEYWCESKAGQRGCYMLR